MKIRKIDPLRPQPDIIREAARVIQRGGVVSFPTRCLYGLGADALNVDAVDRIFQIKKRPYNKPLLVLIKNRKDLCRLVTSVPPAAACIMESFWPGRVTLVFEAKDTLSASLTAGTGKIGVRLPGHPVAFALANELGRPITGTSANLSGNTGCSNACDLDSAIVDKLDFILDAGPLQKGIGSTVVDVIVDPPKILREGEVSARDIFSALNKYS